MDHGTRAIYRWKGVVFARLLLAYAKAKTMKKTFTIIGIFLLTIQTAFAIPSYENLDTALRYSKPWDGTSIGNTGILWVWDADRYHLHAGRDVNLSGTSYRTQLQQYAGGINQWTYSKTLLTRTYSGVPTLFTNIDYIFLGNITGLDCGNRTYQQCITTYPTLIGRVDVLTGENVEVYPEPEPEPEFEILIDNSIIIMSRDEEYAGILGLTWCCMLFIFLAWLYFRKKGS